LATWSEFQRDRVRNRIALGVEPSVADRLEAEAQVKAWMRAAAGTKSKDKPPDATKSSLAVPEWMREDHSNGLSNDTLRRYLAVQDASWEVMGVPQARRSQTMQFWRGDSADLDYYWTLRMQRLFRTMIVRARSVNRASFGQTGDRVAHAQSLLQREIARLTTNSSEVREALQQELDRQGLAQSFASEEEELATPWSWSTSNPTSPYSMQETELARMFPSKETAQPDAEQDAGTKQLRSSDTALLQHNVRDKRISRRKRRNAQNNP